MTITTARQHGAGSSKPSASWSTRHCPVHCITALTTGNFVPQIRSPARPLVSFLIIDFFENRAGRQDHGASQLHAWSGNHPYACTTRVWLPVCAHARDECRSQSARPECDAEP